MKILRAGHPTCPPAEGVGGSAKGLKLEKY